MIQQWKVFVALLVILSSFNAVAKTKPHEPDWGVCNPQSSARIDHSTWQRLLHRYLYKGADNVNLFHYGIFSKTDRRHLKNYLKYLQAINILQYNADEQLAYWTMQKL